MKTLVSTPELPVLNSFKKEVLKTKLCMVAHAFHLSPWEAGAGGIPAGLVYIVRPCSKNVEGSVGEMDQQLRTFSALAEAIAWLLPPTSVSSQLPIAPEPAGAGTLFALQASALTCTPLPQT